MSKEPPIEGAASDSDQSDTLRTKAQWEEERSPEPRDDRLDSFVASTDLCVLILSAAGLITSANAPALVLIGRSLDQIFGKHINTLNRGRASSMNSQMRSAEVSWGPEGDDSRAVQLSISKIHSEADNTEYLCVAQDLTDRKSAEEKLRQGERLLRQVAETIEDGFYVAEFPSFELTYVSPAFENIFGFSREQLYQQPGLTMNIVHPDDSEELKRAFERFVMGDPCDEQYRIVREDGEVRWIRERAFFVEEDDGRVERIVGITQDITEHRQFELELRQGQRMEAIGQLASGVAHDFNNILMGIHGCASIGISKVPETSEVRQFLEAIRKSSEGGTAIIKQLLAFSSIRELDVRTFDLNGLLLGDQTMLTRLLGDDVVLKISTSVDPSWLRMDLGQLEQILMNLAINARDAMPDGGELCIETEVLDLPDFGDDRPDGGNAVAICVRDSGSGMSEAVRERIFEPFFTTKDIGSGTGLGLSTVYGIVKEAGGFIRCQSTVGVGTTFLVTLPRGVSEGAQDLVRPDSDPGLDGRGGTILLVEDEATVRMATRVYLESEGYEVVEAADGPQAVEMLNAGPVDIDLVLTDVGLPGFSGAGLAAWVRQMADDLPVVFMSAHPENWLVSNGRLNSGESTLQKPFSRSELLVKVGEAIAIDRNEE